MAIFIAKMTSMRKLIILFILFASITIQAQDDLPVITIDTADNPSDAYIYLETLRRNLEEPNPTPPNGSNVTEVTQNGEIVFALSLPPDLIAYRVYRYDQSYFRLT